MCQSLAEFCTDESCVPDDREMSQMAALAVLDVLDSAGLGHAELRDHSLETLSRLTRFGVLQGIKPLWDCAERIALWARENAPEVPSSASSDV